MIRSKCAIEIFIDIQCVECGVGHSLRKVTGGGLGSVWLAAESKRGHHSRSHSKAWQWVDIFLFSVPNETVWWFEGLQAIFNTCTNLTTPAKKKKKH